MRLGRYKCLFCALSFFQIFLTAIRCDHVEKTMALSTLVFVFYTTSRLGIDSSSVVDPVGSRQLTMKLDALYLNRPRIFSHLSFDEYRGGL